MVIFFRGVKTERGKLSEFGKVVGQCKRMNWFICLEGHQCEQIKIRYE